MTHCKFNWCRSRGFSCNAIFVPFRAMKKTWSIRQLPSFWRRLGCKAAFPSSCESSFLLRQEWGGGSSDAAATLYALNRLTHAGIPLETLCEWGLQLGADVPFFFYGGTAFADGIGERLKALPAQAGTLLLLAKGRIGVSTKTAYQKLDGCSNLQHPNVQELKHCILQGKLLVQLAPLCSNLFEQGISNAEISSIQQTLSLIHI